MIIIDALGYDITRHHDFRPAGLDKIAKAETVFGFSQAALTTIMTGALPDHHGLWMMYSFDQQGSPFKWLRNMPRFVSTERRWVRTIIDRQITRSIGVSAYYNLYDVPARELSFLDLPARKQLFSPGSVPGRETIIDTALRKNIPLFIRYYNTEEKKAFNDLALALDGGGDGLFLLYTAGFDSTLHRRGTLSEETGLHLRWYEKRIGEIASSRDDLRIFVLGDHGMCDVTAVIDVMGEIGRLGLSVPEDYIPFYDSTMARFRFNSGRGRELVGNVLTDIKGGRILEEKELRRLGVWFDDQRFGEMIFLADPGVMIVPCFMGKKPIAGMHGYHPGAPCMDSVLYSNVPAVPDRISLTEIAGMILPGNGGMERR